MRAAQRGAKKSVRRPGWLPLHANPIVPRNGATRIKRTADEARRFKGWGLTYAQKQVFASLLGVIIKFRLGDCKNVNNKKSKYENN